MADTSGRQTTVGENLSARSASPARSSTDEERPESGDEPHSERVGAGEERPAERSIQFRDYSGLKGEPPSYSKDLDFEGKDGQGGAFHDGNMARVQVSSGKRDCQSSRRAALQR